MSDHWCIDNWPCCTAGCGSMAMMNSACEDRNAAGINVLASFAVDTITARAALSSRIC
jgi:hypothetical protein